ncbi:MAG TPA: hypothetical protein PKC18_16465, partial [Lacipirellulaceae bacterium]|nr:hypothetical protein [Lacipirellulaceae bacterium]
KTFNAQISDRLLRIGSIKKVGAVQVIALDGELLAYYCAKVPAELSPEQMETLVNTVAYIADDAENTLFGGDEY